LVFFWLIKVLDISYPLTITTMTKAADLSVVGEGKVDVVPDKAQINLGITVQNATSVAEAQQAINEVNNKIVQAMKNLGVKAADIKTSNYSITPNYSSGFQTTRVISGYNGDATVTITARNPSLVSQVLEAATAAGANEVQGVSYSVEDPNKYREEARNKAIVNAKEQAAKLAKTLGIRLGRVTNIVESSPSNVYPLRAAAGVGGESAVIEPGTQTITSTVTLYFQKN
jgi:uncharacterized protein YggE